ncbi:MAG: ATP phosphoribosyltransferase regulatory subunit [Candidatus Dormibacteria bacterium]
MAEPLAGFVDLLPAEAELRRTVEARLCAELGSWGYRAVATPLLEDAGLLAILGPEAGRRLLKLVDQGGRVAALVAERTLPVARVVAGQLRGEPLPLRLLYSAPVVALEGLRPAGRREGWQVGAELVGAAGSAADAEGIALAAAALEAAGLRSFHLDVGHAGFFRGLLEGLGGQGDLAARVAAALSRRDFVELERALSATRLRTAEHELMLRFPTLRGGPDLLEAARPLVTSDTAARALDELAEVCRVLEGHGLSEVVNVDLGAIRDFDYYTGITFEAFSLDLGWPLAAGGRYDLLLGQLGRDLPATGFVIHLELVEEALRRARRQPEAGPRALVGHRAGAHPEALELARQLRAAGVAAECETAPATPAALRSRARERAADFAFLAGPGGATGGRAGAAMRQLSVTQAVALARGRA